MTESFECQMQTKTEYFSDQNDAYNLLIEACQKLLGLGGVG